jgi:REP element-mobilizing transposase RayT
MPRRPRELVAGGYYHVVNRGVEQRELYLDDADRSCFLGWLDRVVARRGWSCLAYCLMSNHYHLLVRTPEPDLSAGMHELNGRYARAFNERHKRVGHLFQGRYKSIRIKREAHLLATVRYVVRNPVAAGLAPDARSWRWSSHRAALRIAPAGLVAVHDLSALFAATFGGDARSPEVYARFVDEWSTQPDRTTWTRRTAYDSAPRTAWSPAQSETPEAVISAGARIA